MDRTVVRETNIEFWTSQNCSLLPIHYLISHWATSFSLFIYYLYCYYDLLLAIYKLLLLLLQKSTIRYLKIWVSTIQS